MKGGAPPRSTSVDACSRSSNANAISLLLSDTPEKLEARRDACSLERVYAHIYGAYGAGIQNIHLQCGNEATGTEAHRVFIEI